jgi:hypothetical protein
MNFYSEAHTLLGSSCKCKFTYPKSSTKSNALESYTSKENEGKMLVFLLSSTRHKGVGRSGVQLHALAFIIAYVTMLPLLAGNISNLF